MLIPLLRMLLLFLLFLVRGGRRRRRGGCRRSSSSRGGRSGRRGRRGRRTPTTLPPLPPCLPLPPAAAPTTTPLIHRPPDHKRPRRPRRPRRNPRCVRQIRLARIPQTSPTQSPPSAAPNTHLNATRTPLPVKANATTHGRHANEFSNRGTQKLLVISRNHVYFAPPLAHNAVTHRDDNTRTRRTTRIPYREYGQPTCARVLLVSIRTQRNELRFCSFQSAVNSCIHAYSIRTQCMPSRRFSRADRCARGWPGRVLPKRQLARGCVMIEALTGTVYRRGWSRPMWGRGVAGGGGVSRRRRPVPEEFQSAHISHVARMPL